MCRTNETHQYVCELLYPSLFNVQWKSVKESSRADTNIREIRFYGSSIPNKYRSI